MSISKSTTIPWKGFEIEPGENLSDYRKEGKRKKKGREGIHQDIAKIHLGLLNSKYKDSNEFLEAIVDYIVEREKGS